MPGETTNYKIKYSLPADEVKAASTEVSEPAAKTIDKALSEHLPKIAEHATSLTAASGEWVKATGAITVTLPSPTANATVAVSANNHEVKIGAGAALIYGGFITGSTPITLIGYQWVVLQSDGTNWFILAGEPKREATNSALTSLTESTQYEPSATRLALVTLTFTGASGKESQAIVEVGSTAVAEWAAEQEGVYGAPKGAVTVPVGPGQKLRWRDIGGTAPSVEYSTYLL